MRPRATTTTHPCLATTADDIAPIPLSSPCSPYLTTSLSPSPSLPPPLPPSAAPPAPFMQLKLLALTALFACASATSLTPDNVDGAVAGKSVFIKFQAPW